MLATINSVSEGRYLEDMQLANPLSRRASGSISASLDGVTADAVILLAEANDEGVRLRAHSSTALDAAVLAGLAGLGFTGKPGSSARVVLEGSIKSATVVGVSDTATDADIAGAVAGAIRATTGVASIAIDVQADVATVYRAALLTTYRFNAYKAAAGVEVEQITVIGEAPADLARLDDLISAISFARDLTTLPAADKTPQKVTALIAELAEAVGCEMRVYEQSELRELGTGGLLAVGQGSVHPPVLIRLHAKAASDGAPTVAVVGKGLTYDAGGMNLKLSMLEHMKLDVGGAAASAAAALHAAAFPGEKALTVWLPLCENVMSGSSFHTGDVLKMHNGLTVEVINTDAEGRLVLADALSLASLEQPEAVLTIATLTGTAMMALGPRTAGLMTKDDALAERVLAAAEAGGDDFWRMPMRAHFAEPLESEIADLNNLGDAKGQIMIAAFFLSRFAGEGIPFAHLDIAGPAFNMGKAYKEVPSGGTGFGVGTIVELLNR